MYQLKCEILLNEPYSVECSKLLKLICLEAGDLSQKFIVLIFCLKIWKEVKMKNLKTRDMF